MLVTPLLRANRKAEARRFARNRWDDKQCSPILSREKRNSLAECGLAECRRAECRLAEFVPRTTRATSLNKCSLCLE